MIEAKDRLKELRCRTGLSQAKFARKFFIPVGTYEHWEMGIRKPPAYVVKMMSLILDYEDKYGTI